MPRPQPPVRSFDMLLDEEILELSPLPLASGAGLLVLGRRSLWLYRVQAGSAVLQDRIDLLSSIDPQIQVERRARSCLQVPPAGAGAAAWVQLFSTALGVGGPGGATVILQAGRLIPARPVQFREPGPCDAFLEGWTRDWSGRTLLLSSDPLLLAHVERDGALVLTSPSGEPGRFDGPFGEPLASLTAAGTTRLYISSTALPGAPDRVEEFLWDGEVLTEGRRSREFPGRISALAFLHQDGRVAVAEVGSARTGRLHLLKDDELWEEPVP